jgi:hypothetical protein
VTLRGGRRGVCVDAVEVGEISVHLKANIGHQQLPLFPAPIGRTAERRPVDAGNDAGVADFLGPGVVRAADQKTIELPLGEAGASQPREVPMSKIGCLGSVAHLVDLPSALAPPG